jgi:hypothetical protein
MTPVWHLTSAWIRLRGWQAVDSCCEWHLLSRWLVLTPSIRSLGLGLGLGATDQACYNDMLNASLGVISHLEDDGEVDKQSISWPVVVMIDREVGRSLGGATLGTR